MSTTFASGGIIMWPLLAVAAGIGWVAVRTALRLRRGAMAADEAGRGLQAILFWGGMAVLLGLLGTVVGLIQVTQAVALAGSVHPPLVWGGVGVALVTLGFGLLIFLVATITWFGLSRWHLRVAGRREAPAGY